MPSRTARAAARRGERGVAAGARDCLRRDSGHRRCGVGRGVGCGSPTRRRCSRSSTSTRTASPRGSRASSSSAAGSGSTTRGRISATGATTLLEGLLRFDELRSIQAEDAAPADRDARADRLRRLLLAVVDDVRVLIMQIALTLHRLRNARARPSAERARLAREALDVYAPLASRLGIWQYKWEIEDLAFRESEPATYKAIAGQLNERRVDRERYIEGVVRRIEAELGRQAIDAEVTGRAKHIHSIWRKMRRKSLGIEQAGIEQPGIDQLFDLRAVRGAGGNRGRVLHGARGRARAVDARSPRVRRLRRQPQAERLPVAAHRGHRAGRQDARGADPHPRDARSGRARGRRALALQGGRAGSGARARRPDRVAATAPRSPRGGPRVRVPAQLARHRARIRARLRLHPTRRHRRPSGRLDAARLRLPDPHPGRPPMPGREGRRAGSCR